MTERFKDCSAANTSMEKMPLTPGREEEESWGWWCMSAISALGRLRQDDGKLQASVGWIWDSFFFFFVLLLKIKRSKQKPMEARHMLWRLGKQLLHSLLGAQGELQAETQKEGEDAAGAFCVAERGHCWGWLKVSPLPKHRKTWPPTANNLSCEKFPRRGTGPSVHRASKYHKPRQITMF